MQKVHCGFVNTNRGETKTFKSADGQELTQEIPPKIKMLAIHYSKDKKEIARQSLTPGSAAYFDIDVDAGEYSWLGLDPKQD